jgi:hypothetical protein
MELKFALLADHASETKEGKLNIMGTFNAVGANEVPVTHPRCYLVARLECSLAHGTDHTFRVSLHDGNGEIAGMDMPDQPLRFVPSGPGRTLVSNIIIDMVNLRLSEFDDFEFHLRVDGVVVATVPLSLVQIQPNVQG